MRKFIAAASAVAVMFATGCASVPGIPAGVSASKLAYAAGGAGVGALATKYLQGKGGSIGALQTLDDAIAKKFGVSADQASKIRGALNITDVRALPGEARVLPVGYTWKQDLFDADGKLVDLTKLHTGPVYIVADGTVATPITPISTNDAQQILNALLQAGGKTP